LIIVRSDYDVIEAGAGFGGPVAALVPLESLVGSPGGFFS